MHQIIVEDFSLSPFSSISDWFSQFQHTSGAVLLDSGETKHSNARFHIATALPLVTLDILSCGKINLSYSDNSLNDQSPDGNSCKQNGPDQSVIQSVDLAQMSLCAKQKEQLNALVQAYPCASDVNLLIEAIQSLLFGEHIPAIQPLPFSVGCMGYASYDYGRFLETLPEQTAQHYKTPVFSVSFYSWSLVTDILNEKVWLSYSSKFGKPNLTFNSNPVENTDFRLCSDWQSNMTRAEYIQKLNDIHEYLLAGDCYQVNLAQRFSARYEGCEWQAWKALTAENQAPFSGFLRLAESCILSCSPERFLSVNQGVIETKPIKGTRPRFSDAVKDEEARQALIASEKDRSENLMIVDLLRNDLSKNAQPHSVQVEGLFEIESFRAVHHMVSTISAKIAPDSNAVKVFKDAFPGGSITGAPKIRAMEIIEELEPDRRNIYCGSIFYLDVQGHFDSNICIRTLLFEQDMVYCWAGGGIVADSDPAAEYEETLHKVGKILPTLDAL